MGTLAPFPDFVHCACKMCKTKKKKKKNRQIHNGVFMKVNKATMNMLRRVEPWVAYGFPNRKTVEPLVYQSGYGKVNGQRVKLYSNFVVEGTLSKKNMLCVEDVVNEVVTCGPAFKEVNNFLWPFKLNPPKGGYASKTKTYLNMGDQGNREAFINEFVRR